MLLPDVGKAGLAADLLRRLLKRIFSAVAIDVARFRYLKKFAEVQKMLLRGRSLGACRTAPFGNKMFGGHPLPARVYGGHGTMMTIGPASIASSRNVGQSRAGCE